MEKKEMEVEKTTKTETVEKSGPIETKKKRSKLPWIILGCLSLICICCLCFFVFFGSIFGLVFNGVGDVLEDFVAICDASDSELSTIYEDNFTRGYQRETSYEEFVTFYNSNEAFFTGTCSDLKELNFQNLANGFDFSIENDSATLQLTTSDGELNLKAVEETKGEWKIDEISID